MSSRSVTLALPPFPKAIKTLVALNAGIYVLLLVMSAVGYGGVANSMVSALALRADDVVHGRIYELLTYGFIHAGFFHVFFNMLMLWMFGSMLEVPWGSRKFWDFYLFGVVGAALGTVALAYTLGKIVHLTPFTATVGSSGGLYAIYMAVGMLFGDQEVFMFPLPIAIRLKYLVGILAFISFAGALGDAGGTANVAHLSGLLFGYIYIKFVPRRGLSYGFSEGYFGVRNSFHRWKRRRAAKKFQVYMRKHEHDPKQYFDEYGNFKPPDEHDKKGPGPGGWVN
jgi:membrane associated rhomboid family serine protease